MNQEGYQDPTAEKAIYRTQRLPDRIYEVIKVTKGTLSLLGLNIVSITVEDQKTKKKHTWRR